MSIAGELIGLCRTVAGRTHLPPVRLVYIPPPQPDPPRDAEFGVIVLEDGSTGFFYVWLGETQSRLRLHPGLNRLSGTPVLELCERFEDGDEVDAAIGIGAISALYQHLINRSGYQFDTTTNSMARMRFETSDRVGMVGYFPPLVQKLQARGIALTVIEKKSELVGRSGTVEVTLDATRLSECNKVLCTAATLLNHTLDGILACCLPSSRVAVIGPTAGCFPDPLFERGVDIVGGSRVVDPAGLLRLLRTGHPWGHTVQKYTLEAGLYPGTPTLIGRV